jgi:spore maturation protein CgeB
MKILYIGDTSPSSTSRHRSDALERIGHEVTRLSPYQALSGYLQGWAGVLHYRTGYALMRRRVQAWVEQALEALPPHDLCWVDSGDLLDDVAVRRLRMFCGRVVLFNHDDPTGGRDGARFNTFMKGLPEYNLCVVVRPFNVDEYLQCGARSVIRTHMTYDEVRHAPVDAPDGRVPAQFDNDIVFIGRNMNGEGRDLVLLALIRAGLKPAIWGDNWQRSPVWPELAPFWRGGSIAGRDYVDAIRHARICLGMLSKGNRDQHTTRSMEIPYAGGLLCAERTAEHQALYEEGEEAVFWSSPEECVAVCRALLADPVRIARIKAAGRARVISNRVGSEDLCRTVLAQVAAQRATPPRQRVLIMDVQPVQYKAPVYQALEVMQPGLFEVVYASDTSVKGYRDAEFGVTVAWDTPLMSGYRHRVMGNEREGCTGEPRQYHGRGLWQLLKQVRPAAVMLTQSRYHFDLWAYACAVLQGIPVLVRQETQDAMFAQQRGWLKSRVRSGLYRLYYASAQHFFVFGQLNRQHLLDHGVKRIDTSDAWFSVPDPLEWWDEARKLEARRALRASLAIADDAKVVGFFGKLIAKKHPDLILEAVRRLSPEQARQLHLVFVGAGDMGPQLQKQAEALHAECGVQVHFPGFINQSALAPWYLATDVFVLPSRHQGEAWGLVVNEALQAGCAVAITEGVGCHVEFGGWERVRVTPVEDAAALARSLAELLPMPRDFSWARTGMAAYSTRAAAASLRRVFEAYTP